MNGFSTYPFNNFTMHQLTSPEDIQALFEVPGRKGDTVIGHDVWIGMEAVVMPGVNIGHGAIIGARSVVARDVPPYTIVAGNPAQPVKQRFEKKLTKTLLEVQWWDWSVEKIEANMDAITGDDIDSLKRASTSQ
ncbi:UNVERIFIED_CONTAM: hypothetical protein GTU68_039718 [Idotea baltica]|nr:hypothetical protein [Idotea baltica]